MSENKNERDEGGIFDEPKMPKITAKTKRKSDLKRQLRLLFAVCAAAFCVTLSYFFIIKPLTENEVEDNSEEITLLEGESIGPQNRIFIMEYLTRDNIASVTVHNSYGEYGVSYNEDTDAFEVTDDPNAVYDREKLQSLLSAAGYTLAIERITDNADNLAEYGLSDLDSPAWYTITDRSGNSHKLYIGDIIPSNAGYYVRYDGRNAVYVLDSSIAETLLSPIEAIISPILTFPVPQNAYQTITNFAIINRDELVVMLEYITDGEMLSDGSKLIHKFLYPEQYYPNETNYLDAFSKFCDFSGTSALVYKPDSEDMKKYGLDDPEFDLYFEYSSVPNNLIFSEKNENGNRYAYSPLFNVITEIEADKTDFLEWGLIDWIERPIFRMNIASVREIKLESKKENYDFELLYDGDNLIAVNEKQSGRSIADIDNFRKFYQTILMTNIQDYAELDSESIDKLTDSEAYLTLTVVMENTDVKIMKFYPYETRKSYFTSDGKGDFYVLRDRMIKIIDDAEKALNGIAISPDANN